MSFDEFKSSGPLQMTAEQARDIFEKRIVPAIGAKGPPPEHPALILVAGQQGSGKSTAIRQAEMGLAGATQKIIGDDFAAWVPGYHELAKTHPVKARNSARSAGWPYFFKATANRAEQMRANIIMECAIPTASTPNAAWYRKLGYHTELHIVATPHYQSWTGVLDRAENALSAGHIGTNVLVPRDAHDETYASWARAIFDAEQHGEFDRIKIVRRDGNVVYDNHLVEQDGAVKWAKPAQGLEYLLQERHRSVSDDNATRAKEAWDRIVHSPHVQSDAYLKGLPLAGYQKEIGSYVKSAASRISLATRGPGKFSKNAIKDRHTTILYDLSYARRVSRNEFGASEEFDRRTRQYGRRITAVAKEYATTAISNFSLPTRISKLPTQNASSEERSGINGRQGPATAPKLAQDRGFSSLKRHDRLLRALDLRATPFDKARIAVRSLKQKTKEFVDKPFGSRRASRATSTFREDTDTSKVSGGQVKGQNMTGQMSQPRDARQGPATVPQLAQDRGSSAASLERHNMLLRALDPRDRSDRSR